MMVFVLSQSCSCLKLPYLSRDMRNPGTGFPTRSDTNRAAQLLNMARGLKFRIWVEEVLYYPGCKNKGVDQLRGYSEADLRLVFAYAKSRFSNDTAHLSLNSCLFS